MIMEWKDRHDIPPIQQIVGAIFDAGLITRNDLKTVFDGDEDALHYRLRKARRHDPPLIQHHSLPSGKGYVYGLSTSGVAYAYDMLQITGRIVTMEAQFSHQLNLNSILFRLLNRVDKKYHNARHVAWYSTREATDTLFAIRRKNGESEVKILPTLIKPDAMLGIAVNNYKEWRISYIEYDNATESVRQLLKKMRLYITNLTSPYKDVQDKYPPLPIHTVVWVAKTKKRRDQLEELWNDLYENRVTMHFFTRGEETLELLNIGDIVDSKP